MATLSNSIISVFLEKRALQLTDAEIFSALQALGIPCTLPDVRQQAESLSPALFQLTTRPNQATTIRVDPTVSSIAQHIRPSMLVSSSSKYAKHS